MPQGSTILTTLVLGAGALALAAQRDAARSPRQMSAGSKKRTHPATLAAARKFNRGSGLLALSVLCDSALEHYRGSFKNKAMYTPLIVSAATIGVSVHGTADARAGAHKLRDAVYATAAATGLVGTGFHIYNVGKRVGGFSFQNLFYAAPLGAPLAILLSGLLGFCAERVRENERGVRLRIFGVPAGQLMAAVTSVGLIGTSGEAGLLHLRGAYHDPFMVLPVTVPPVGSVLLSRAGSRRRLRGAARFWMRATVGLGFIGVAFHAFGVARNMGGWRNWSQNILNGPPLPAPPSFTGLALAGLAALDLLEHPDA